VRRRSVKTDQVGTVTLIRRGTRRNTQDSSAAGQGDTQVESVPDQQNHRQVEEEQQRRQVEKEQQHRQVVVEEQERPATPPPQMACPTFKPPSGHHFNYSKQFPMRTISIS